MDLTKEQAISLYNTKWWEYCSDREAAEFQLTTPLLCMPFDKFHEKMEKCLSRDIQTIEFAFSRCLKEELLNGSDPTTLNRIVYLLPPDIFYTLPLELRQIER